MVSISSDLLITSTGVAAVLALRYIKPLDISSKLDRKKHAKPLLPLILSNKMLGLVSLFLPPVILFLVELIVPSTSPSRGLVLAFNYISRWCLTAIPVQTIKLIVSSPRPNAVHLEDHRVNKKYNNSNYESRQSFFSGHAAGGLMASLFLKKYLQQKFQLNHINSFSLFLLPILGLYPGYTQFKNNWHHLHDVLIGYLYGIICYFIAFVWFYDWQ